MSKAFIVCAGFLLAIQPAGAAASAPLALMLKDHKFFPAEIHVKANQPNVINLTNKDDTAEEFDSAALKIEKVIAGGGEGTVHLRPLDADIPSWVNITPTRRRASSSPNNAP